jgi:hypothetical protein
MQQRNGISLTGKYTLSQKVLTPSDPDTKSVCKCLLICPSKYQGRRQYLAAKIIGSYKPEFISTIYEPRTPDGWFNIEFKGIRYEVVKDTPDTVYVYEHPAGRKGVTFE